MSFRARLLAVSLGTMAIGLGALVLIGNVLLAQRVRTEAGQQLRAQADEQVAALAVSRAGVRVRATAADAVLDRRAWVLDGRRVIERPPGVGAAVDARAVALGRAGHRADVQLPEDLRLRAVPLRAGGRVVGAVVVQYDTASLERLQEAVLVGSLIVAALVLLAGGLAIRGAVDGALEPVKRMTAAAEDWGAHDLEHRFGLGPPRDELTGLAATLDGLLARIAASRRHEQRFAGEVAHELRTPLAGLRARAEGALEADGPDAEGELRGALEAVVEQADRLGRAVDTLLAMTRQELDPTAGTVDLVALAREVPDAHLDAPAVVPAAEGDPEVVRRAIAPLVDNARRHGHGPVRLEVGAGPERVTLAVCDDGPGVAAESANHVFEPGWTTGAGAGLGLPLAQRLARSCGGDVRLVPGDGPGARFVLELPRLGRGTA